MDPFDTNQSDSSEVRKVEQAQFSRSDLATTRRALSDLETQSGRLTEQVHYQLAKPGQVSLEDFQAGWAQREKLNQISGQIDALKQSISEILPNVSSSPRLSVEEREQICGLYQSRLYTQQQIAEQYGVSQPTIGDIVRKRDERNGD